MSTAQNCVLSKLLTAAVHARYGVVNDARMHIVQPVEFHHLLLLRSCRSY